MGTRKPVAVDHIDHADQMAPATTPLRFIIGQDPAGHWVARETRGRAGGLFRTKDDALHYARSECAGANGGHGKGTGAKGTDAKNSGAKNSGAKNSGAKNSGAKNTGAIRTDVQRAVRVVRRPLLLPL